MSRLIKVKTFLDLCRISNLPTVWTNVLAAVLLSGAGFSWLNFSILTLSMSLFYCGGMCLNDICDLNVDRQERPTRPIPSGRVSAKQAFIFTLILFIIALSLLFYFDFRAIIAGFLLLAMIIAYDKIHKSHFSGVILMAFCRFLVFVVAALAVAGTVGAYVTIAGFSQFIYILAVSTIARHENTRRERYAFPLVPVMISGISALDGILIAVFCSPAWLVAGASGMILTLLGQKYVRGD